MKIFENPTVFYSNHSAALKIARYIILFISFINKLNLKLVKISDYIQKFNIIFKHKFGKQHIVLDVLFHFPIDNIENKLKTKNELNVLFTASLIE